MNNKIENIDSWVGRVFIILILLSVLSFSNSNNGYSSNSNSISVEQIAKIDNSAILASSICYSNYNNSLVCCEIFNIIIGDLNIDKATSNNIINQKLKHQKWRFCKIKSKLLQSRLIYQKICSIEEHSLIS